MRIVLAAALLAPLALALTPALAAPQTLALAPADTNRDGVISPDEAATWLDRDHGVIIPVRLTPSARAAAATQQRRTMFDKGLLRPNDFREPAPEDRPPEDLFYKDFKKIKK